MALARTSGARRLTVLVLAGWAVALWPVPRSVPVLAAGPEGQLPPVTDTQRAQFEQWFAAQPRMNLPVDPGGAKVLVVKFTDYQCPACAKTHLDYKPVVAKYAASHPAEVRFVTLDYPINPACNPSVQYVLHAAACEAAVAVRLARERGRGEAMEDWIATNLAAVTPASVREAVRTVAGVEDFDARYEAVLAGVKTDAALGGLNNVRSTPTFFVNGTMMPPLAPQFFDLAIALALQRGGS